MTSVDPILDSLPRVILVAEDDPSLQEVLCRGLHRRGFSTLCASDGEEAFSIYSESSPSSIHALMTDYLMPKRNGGSLARKIKAIRPEFPIVLATGEAPDQELLELASFQNLVAVIKPFQTSTLLDAVRMALGLPLPDGRPEGRKGARAETRITGVLELDGRKLRTVVRNLGFGGAFLELEPPTNGRIDSVPGAVLEFSFQGLECYPICSKLAWIQTGSGDIEVRLGIQFCPTSPDVCAFLKRFVLNKLKNAGVGIAGAYVLT